MSKGTITNKELLSLYGDLLEKDKFSKIEVVRLIHSTMKGATQGFMTFVKENGTRKEGKHQYAMELLEWATLKEKEGHRYPTLKKKLKEEIESQTN